MNIQEPDYKQLYLALVAQLQAGLNQAIDLESKVEAWQSEADANRAEYNRKIDECVTQSDYDDAKHWYDSQRKQTLEKYGFPADHI